MYPLSLRNARKNAVHSQKRATVAVTASFREGLLLRSLTHSPNRGKVRCWHSISPPTTHPAPPTTDLATLTFPCQRLLSHSHFLIPCYSRVYTFYSISSLARIAFRCGCVTYYCQSKVGGLRGVKGVLQGSPGRHADTVTSFGLLIINRDSTFVHSCDFCLGPYMQYIFIHWVA
jgi:hypothetical protein